MQQSDSSQTPDQRFCPNCGSAIAPGANFCPRCGASTIAPTSPGLPATGAKRTDHIKYRNMIVQVILYIITLGIYGLYWYYVTFNELRLANGKEEGSGCLWTFLLIIPIANLFSYWFHSFEYAEFIDNRYPGIAIFILWIVITPVVWFLVQWELNKAARSRSRATE